MLRAAGRTLNKLRTKPLWQHRTLLSHCKPLFSQLETFAMPRKRIPSAIGRFESTSSHDEDVVPPTPASATRSTSTRVARTGLPVASVIKIFTVASRPNYMQPWQMGPQEQYTGSGFVIEGKRIITNAHVVANNTTVRVRRHGGMDKSLATVLSVNHACDLAMLSVEDEDFWKDLPELKLSNTVPKLDEKVLVIGYPMGGDTISVTRGVVSRVTTLNYGALMKPIVVPNILAVQIDAAINSGNSGGPVFDEEERVVGVAFSGYAGAADNIGYIIPITILNNFLDAARRNEKPDAICNFGLYYQLCENPSLRRKMKMKATDSGVLLVKVAPLGPCKDSVRPGDVLLTINKHIIANDGTIRFRDDERVSLQHTISSHPLGQECEIQVLRDGERITTTMTAGTTPYLVPPYRQPGEKPSYLIVGGIVFTPLTAGLIELCVDDISDSAWKAAADPKEHEDEQLIVIVSILAHAINHGYSIRRIPKLEKCNGEEVRSMKHLKKLVSEAGEFVQFTTSGGKNIILSTQECRDTEAEILDTHAIPSASSEDLADSVDVKEDKSESKDGEDKSEDKKEEAKDEEKKEEETTKVKEETKEKKDKKQGKGKKKDKEAEVAPVKEEAPEDDKSVQEDDGEPSTKRAKRPRKQKRK